MFWLRYSGNRHNCATKTARELERAYCWENNLICAFNDVNLLFPNHLLKYI